MSIFEKIEEIKYITQQDKKILTDAVKNNYDYSIYEKLSFYSRKFEKYSLEDYNYIKTTEEEDIFVTNFHLLQSHSFSNIYLDNEKKIIFFSNWWFNVGIETFIDHIYIFFNNVYEKLDFDNAHFIGSNIISIQTWFTSYGHFLDEVFNLYDFKNKLTEKENKNYYVLTENQTTDYYKNYGKITDILFDDNHHININSLNNNLCKLKNLYLIEHNIFSPTFHKFPLCARNKISNHNGINENICEKENCFITRGKASHLPRNLNNQYEIEKYFDSKNNFSIINPENETIESFVKKIKNKKLIIITWGSALVNLIFANKGTNVIILKSKSYEHENIDLLKHVVQGLNIFIITHKNNEIDITEIENIINSII